MNRIMLRPFWDTTDSDAGDVLTVSLVVDDEVWADGYSWYANLHALSESLRTNGEFVVALGGCGIPGCCGDTTVRVTHTTDTIHWDDTHVFGRGAYVDEVESAIREGWRLLDEFKGRLPRPGHFHPNPEVPVISLYNNEWVLRAAPI